MSGVLVEASHVPINLYDCFGGSGTTAKMAHLLKRNWIISEISKEYVEIAEKRIMPYLTKMG